MVMRLQRRDNAAAGGAGTYSHPSHLDSSSTRQGLQSPPVPSLSPLTPARQDTCLHLSWPSPGPSPSSHLPWIWLPSVLSQLSPLPGSPPCAPPPHTSVYPSKLQTTWKCPHLSPLCPDLPYAKHRVWQGVGVKSFLNATRNGGALVSSGLAWSSPGRRMKDM